MAPVLDKVCYCDDCVAIYPNGRQFSASAYSRHRKTQRVTANAMAMDLDTAQRTVVAETIMQVAPHLSRQIDEAMIDGLEGMPMEGMEVVAGLESVPNAERSATLKKLDLMLDNLHLSILPELACMPRPESLHFSRDPLQESMETWAVILSDVHSSSRPIAYLHHFILSKHSCNEEYMQWQSDLGRWMRNLDILICHITSEPRTVDTRRLYDQANQLKLTLQDALFDLIRWKRDIWVSQRASRDQGLPLLMPAASPLTRVDTSRYLSSHQSHIHPLILTNTVMVVVLNLVFGVSVRGCLTFLAFARGQIQLAATFSNGGIPRTLSTTLPRTLATAFRHLNIEPTLHQFIVCPSCHSLYPAVRPYPMHCGAINVPESPPCAGHLLTKRPFHGELLYAPIKTFMHQDLKQWIAWFLCRPDIEQVIKASQSPGGRGSDGCVTDILGSKAVREFCGRDGWPFIRDVKGEYRLLFALSADGFNPLTNKTAKQIRTSTGIYLICLNLPLAVRQHPHNIHLVGVIPGPKKTKEGELNKYLDLVVDDFLVLWESGIHLTATHLYQHGVDVYGAIIATLCDGLGARELCGFPSITSMPFCISCTLPLSEIENFDFKTWIPRTLDQHRIDAEIWRNSNATSRIKLAEQYHPARYTTLLRLPYFDPIKFTVTDTMHNLFLGLFERHCRTIWGMNIAYDDGDGSLRQGSLPSLPSPEDMHVGRSIVATRDFEGFAKKKVKKDVLYYLCEENGLRRGGKKADLLKELKHFMKDLPANQPGSVVTTAAQARPSMQPIPIHNIPPITNEIAQKFLQGEALFAKGLSIKHVANPPLQCMCFLRGVTFKTPSPIKADMVDALTEWRTRYLQAGGGVPTFGLPALTHIHQLQGAFAAQGQAASSANSPHTGPQPKPKGSAVLGKATLTAYAEDRANMVLPPWISAPPARAGHTEHGKLSADQWRVLCTVNLPITLIRLWGNEDASERRRKMLDNFLDLVIAVEIASLVVTSETLIAEYERRMYRYLTTLKDLYKDTSIPPNLHIALHTGDHMRAFGPSPGFRLFTTERLNNKLQSTNTNYHFSEIEVSMTKAMCRASNLAVFVEQSEHLPKDQKEVFSTAMKADNKRGTRVNDVEPPNEDVSFTPRHSADQPLLTLSPDIFTALLSFLNGEGGRYIPSTRAVKHDFETFLYPNVEDVRELRVGGVRYCTWKTSLGGSHVIVDGVASEGVLAAAQIRHIFSHTRFVGEKKVTELFVALVLLIPLGAHYHGADPYRKFGDFGHLWTTTFQQEVTIVRPQQLVCHYARTEMSITGIPGRCFHVLPLSRIKTLFQIEGWLHDDETEVDAVADQFGGSLNL